MTLQGEQYSLKETLRLSEYKVEESTRRTVSRETSARWSHSFYLVNKFDQNVAYTFCLKFEDTRRKWIKALQDAL